MKVIIDNRVVMAIDEFYEAAMSHHISMGEEVVIAKKQRLIDALNSLDKFYQVYPVARLKKQWIKAGWKEFICEDFHFAYEVCVNELGESFVWVRDAVHSLMYR